MKRVNKTYIGKYNKNILIGSLTFIFIIFSAENYYNMIYRRKYL